jgi:hypothetical protein
MFAQGAPSGKGEGHRVGIVIPLCGDAKEDSRWINFAGRRLSERFGTVTVGLGVAGWETTQGADASPVAILDCETEHLTDLDLTILFGIGLRIYVETRREGTAIHVDGDYFSF